MKTQKQNYMILSGKGEVGTWKLVHCTLFGVKLLLAKERKNDERWAHVYGDFYETSTGEIAGIDIESGVCRCIPFEFRWLVA